jgi:pimeloyl-ACP methyl ester carboxylesterase
VLLVPPMMLAAEIYDVSPATSAVTILDRHGADPWVVDFGAPEREEGGLERTLADHVLAVSDAVARVREITGRDVHLGGYSQGGMFCYQVAAYRRNQGLGSVITFGSPVDTPLAMPFGIPEQLASGVAELLADRVFGAWARPAPSRPASPGRCSGRPEGLRAACASYRVRPRVSCRAWRAWSRSSRARGSRSVCWSTSECAGRPTTPSSCLRTAPTAPLRSISGSTRSSAA